MSCMRLADAINYRGEQQRASLFQGERIAVAFDGAVVSRLNKVSERFIIG
jgi:hypothetical protein